MECFEDNPKLICGLVTSVVALALTIGLIVWSAGTVEPIQFALKYNTLSKTVDNSQVYTGGWYLIGPINSFITFPATNVNIDFANFPGSKSKSL